MKEEDQRLLNDSTQGDGEIEREGGEWRQRRYGRWKRGRGNRYISSGPCCLSASSLKWPFNCRAKSDIKASRVKEDSHILILPLSPPLCVPLTPFLFSCSPLYVFSSVSHPREAERGQAPLISYLITLVMLHIIGKRWAK